MFESPQMISVLFYVLIYYKKSLFFYVSLGAKSVNISYGIESEENEEGDGGHAPSLPLLERDSTVVIVIYFRHHLLKDLKEEEKKKKRMYDPLRIIVIYWKMPKGYIYIYAMSNRTYGFQLRRVPAEVFGNAHHLIDDAVHFLQCY